jgi:feruloyl-CoA synthase
LGQQFRSLLPTSGIADVYGLTETCTSDFILPPHLFDRYPGSIGFPSPGVKFRIADQATGYEVSPGSTGEIEIKTEFVMSGYLDTPDLTRAAFREGYFRTGDLAWQSEDGAVYLAGRSNSP